MRTLVRDIWDMRQAKLKKGIDQMLAQQETYAKVQWRMMSCLLHSPLVSVDCIVAI